MTDAGPPDPTRRQALAAAIGSAAALALPACTTDPANTPAPSPPADHPDPQAEPPTMTAASSRMPVVYLPHGGGPWPFVDVGFGDRAELDSLAAYLRSIAALTPTKPKALLVISAHWEEPRPTLMTGANPPLLFDYYGFPPASYQLTWPAPGAPKVAARVRELLAAAQLTPMENADRGYDHGTFVPLKLAYPEADIPVVQLSLIQGLDPALHLVMGKALAPLRDEGVFIIGSGMSYHNLRAFGPAGRKPAAAFDAWLRETTAADPAKRDQGLVAWASAPSARQAHPREEHLMPLMVIAGAAGQDRGSTAFSGTFAGLQLSAHHFG
jgi:aromatic ring-opening dioxygenase catalytic subunit (LigB family)